MTRYQRLPDDRTRAVTRRLRDPADFGYAEGLMGSVLHFAHHHHHGHMCRLAGLRAQED